MHSELSYHQQHLWPNAPPLSHRPPTNHLWLATWPPPPQNWPLQTLRERHEKRWCPQLLPSHLPRRCHILRDSWIDNCHGMDWRIYVIYWETALVVSLAGWLLDGGQVSSPGFHERGQSFISWLPQVRAKFYLSASMSEVKVLSPDLHNREREETVLRKGWVGVLCIEAQTPTWPHSKNAYRKSRYIWLAFVRWLQRRRTHYLGVQTLMVGCASCPSTGL